ncbi:unnamed protein product [Mytilus edulis]|uniref:C1q domain-containing protein n=1 Tax=Mytilus edulis TaxID=6550 RepID=A0A8S3TG82_MYTED|nr:unnamed protein product [Mytilus edulis]
MPDICKNAGVKRYTGHSLRSTAITAMIDAGLTDRSIMFMSDHKCKESLKNHIAEDQAQSRSIPLVRFENHTKIHPSPEFKDEDKGTLFNIVEPKSRLYEEKRLLLPQITTPGAILTKVAFYARVKESMHDLGFNQAISFESVVLDTHNAFHGTSGVFTAPRAGNYAFWG